MVKRNKGSRRSYKDDAWGKQSFETDLEFNYFTVFLNMGAGRRMKDLPGKIMGMYGRKVTTDHLYSISSRNSWMERCARWDRYLSECILTDKELVVREMEIRHSSGAKRFLSAIDQTLTDGLSKQENGEGGLTVSKFGYLLDALTRSYERVARLERTTYGEIDNKTVIETDIKQDIKDIDRIMDDPEIASELSTLFEQLELDEPPEPEPKPVGRPRKVVKNPGEGIIDTDSEKARSTKIY